MLRLVALQLAPSRAGGESGGSLGAREEYAGAWSPDLDWSALTLDCVVMLLLLPPFFMVYVSLSCFYRQRPQSTSSALAACGDL